MTTLRNFNVITVSREALTNEFKTSLEKDLTESEAKNNIRIAIKRDGFGVLMSRTNPSCYPTFHKLTKKLANKYIKVMNDGNFQKVLKMYDELEKIGLKVGINY